MKKKKSNISKWPVPAFLLIGRGVGILTRQVAAFTLIGFGLGLLVTYLNLRKKR